MSTRNFHWYVASILGVLFLFSFGAQARAQYAVSTFDTDTEGWTVGGDTTSITPAWKSSGGTPGGFIQTTDQVVGGVMYWIAPPKFLGNVGAAYGTLLRFDLKQSLTSSQFNAYDVLLKGAGITLVYDTSYNPGLSWTHYDVPLSEAGWHVGTLTGPAPTQAQFLSVLQSLDQLKIRAEFRTGSDSDGLDNVVLDTAAHLMKLGVSAKVMGGGAYVGRVYLDVKAPAGGVVVQLSTTNPAVHLPAGNEATILPGKTYVAFTFSTDAVAAAQSGEITAKLGLMSLTMPITARPIAVKSLVLDPYSVTGGNSVTGTVTLEAPAAPGDVVVTLSSGKKTVAYPTVASITIPAGQTTGTFSVATNPVTLQTTVSISAKTAGGSKGAKLLVNP